MFIKYNLSIVIVWINLGNAGHTCGPEYSGGKINFMSLLEDYFETYLPYSTDLSLNTINSYKQSFMLLLRYMLEIKGIVANDINFSDLTYETLLEFLNWLEVDRLCSTFLIYREKEKNFTEYFSLFGL